MPETPDFDQIVAERHAAQPHDLGAEPLGLFEARKIAQQDGLPPVPSRWFFYFEADWCLTVESNEGGRLVAIGPMRLIRFAQPVDMFWRLRGLS